MVSSAMTIDDEHVEREDAVQRVAARAGAASRRRRAAASPSRTRWRCTTSGTLSAPPAAAGARRSVRWRARTASGSPASTRWTISTSRSLVDVDDDLVGRLAGEEAPQRDVARRRSPRGISTKPGRPAPPRQKRDHAPAPADHLGGGLASEPGGRPRGARRAGSRGGAAGAGAARPRRRAPSTAPMTHVARREARQDEQVDRREPGRAQQDAAHGAPPARTAAASRLSASSGSGQRPDASDEQREARRSTPAAASRCAARSRSPRQKSYW